MCEAYHAELQQISTYSGNDVLAFQDAEIEGDLSAVHQGRRGLERKLDAEGPARLQPDRERRRRYQRVRRGAGDPHASNRARPAAVVGQHECRLGRCAGRLVPEVNQSGHGHASPRAARKHVTEGVRRYPADQVHRVNGQGRVRIRVADPQRQFQHGLRGTGAARVVRGEKVDLELAPNDCRQPRDALEFVSELRRPDDPHLAQGQGALAPRVELQEQPLRHSLAHSVGIEDHRLSQNGRIVHALCRNVQLRAERHRQSRSEE